MTFADVPWLELAILLPLIGALWVSRLPNSYAASRGCLVFTALTLASTVGAWAGVNSGLAPDGTTSLSLLPRVFGTTFLTLDGLSAPLLVLVALLHFLTVLATARTKMSRFSFTWLLVSESLRLSMFGCAETWGLGVLMTLNTVPTYFELVRRGQPTRVYVLHMGLFVILLFAGLAAQGSGPVTGWAASILLLLAVLIRSGTFPAHVWVTDLFAKGSFGNSLLFVTPIAGMYAAVRLVLPTAPDWVLTGIGAASLLTAVYAASMALIQTDTRRFFAFLFLSHSSLILVGLELHTVISLTGALSLWIAVALALSGLGLTLRALEARFGRMNMVDFRGLYGHSPALAVCFLLTGLASVGFPGTLGFVATELLIDGAIGVNPFVGLAVIVAAAINGMAIVRAYFLLFTGARIASGVSLGITARERVAVLTLAALMLGGGLAPQAHIASCHGVAERIIQKRQALTEVSPF